MTTTQSTDLAALEARYAELQARADAAAARLYSGATKTSQYAQRLARQLEQVGGDLDRARAAASAADYIYCRTRTGTKVHIASPGSSVTHCGHWMKYQAGRYRVPAAKLNPAVLCERCAPNGPRPDLIMPDDQQPR